MNSKNPPKRIAFFGSSSFSLPILQKLLTLNSFDLVAVITKPDKAFGRDQIVTANPVADLSRQHNLNLLQPADFTPDFVSQFKNLSLDIALCVAYGPPFFTQELIDIPAHKIVNIHPSPLPYYRGATPGPWQIINGETTSSVTFFQIDALPDHGPIIRQIPFTISPQETSESFYKKAFELASDNLESVLLDYIAHPDNLTPQNHSLRTYFPKLTKDNAKIDWSMESQKIERFIRALLPWPVAWTEVKNSQNDTFRMKILSATIDDKKSLSLGHVQLEGKKPAPWDQLKNHYQILR